MTSLFKKATWAALIVFLYFTAWTNIRAFVTGHAVIPQVDYAASACDDTIRYENSRSTSFYLHVYDPENGEYDTFGYVTPAGFYLLTGLLFLVLAGATRRYYLLLSGFHFGFWLVSVLSVLPGLCVSSFFLHITILGTQYLTPFVTFFIMIMAIKPKPETRLRSNQNH